MAHENQNHLGANSPFWEFVRSMDSLGLDRNGPPPPPPPNNDAHPPHPPPPHGPPPHGGPPPPGGPLGDFTHPMGFPFDGSNNGPWGFNNGRGRHAHSHGNPHGRGPRHHGHRRHRSRTPSSSESDRSRSRSHSPHPRPEGVRKGAREGEETRDRASSPHGDRGPHAHWEGRRGRRGWRRGGPPPFGPFGPFGGYGAWHGGWQGPPGPGHNHRGPPQAANWDPAFLSNLASHPFVRNILQNVGSLGAQFSPQNNDNSRNAGEAAGESAGDNDESIITPAVDIFTTPTAYTLHVSIPGAKKEDIGVHYAATTSILTISGVIYRPGNEEFLATMTSNERQVGMFEKNVVLKGEDGGEVDGDAITAKLEDGVLFVTVPRVEKEWEDVKRVDID